MLEDIKNIKSGRKQLREFGLTIGGVLLMLGGLAMWRGKTSWPYLLCSGSSFLALGIVFPEVLKPLQKAWMALGLVIGFFVSHGILAILFYFVITPIGLLIKFFGKDVLDQRIDKRRDSYWHMRTGPARTKESYENQY
ncbi:MAG: SxtJ family membrane protein [Candidatus Omnitrophica bacterium]|nr:SxtJ family membrane protein [Candidatus Omnitrophota bacterium]